MLPFSSAPCAAAEEQASAPAEAAPAVAADEPADPVAYDRAIDDALAEHRSRNFEEAREHFLRAHKLFPNARTLRGLGKVEFELRNYGEALRYLNEALKSNLRPLDSELRGETEKLLTRAKAYVGEVRVSVDPDSAVVSIDGMAVTGGADGSFTLKVGDHVLDFHAHGRMSERRSIHVSGGEELFVHVVLPRPSETLQVESKPQSQLATIPPPLAPRPAKTDDGWLRKNKVWFWIVIGAAAAGALATGLGLGLTHDRQTRTADPVTSSHMPTGASIVVREAP